MHRAPGMSPEAIVREAHHNVLRLPGNMINDDQSFVAIWPLTIPLVCLCVTPQASANPAIEISFGQDRTGHAWPSHSVDRRSHCYWRCP
jgi:hypothetical protein